MNVILKELVDNGIDACEDADIAPKIKVTITIPRSRKKPMRIVVEDNGPGIPPETINGIINYNVRVSSREAYISPTRGRQGNALKTILPMGYVLGGKVKGETWIEAHGRKHRILFTVNQIKQEPRVENIPSRSRVTTGTRVTVFWPNIENPPDDDAIDNDEDDGVLKSIADLLKEFIWVNPHLTLQFTRNGKQLINCKATNPDWKKYRACEATSAHWYNLEQIERYAGALIDRDLQFREQHPRTNREKYTVREFVAQFRGMSATEKQKQILRELAASHMTLHRFFGSEKQVNHQRMEKLLRLLKEHTRPVRPELLGVIGEDHLRKFCIEAGGQPESFKYSASLDQNSNGVPYVVETAICPYKKWVSGKDAPNRELITGVNFSATLKNPFTTLKGMQGMEEILAEARAGKYAPVIVCVHYACPHIEYLDRGKSRIGLE